MNQNQKRIVIIEGDAFDADAIVAIIKSYGYSNRFGVLIKGLEPSVYHFANEAERNVALSLAIAAWRDVDLVYALPPATDEILPYQPLPPRPEPEHWSDEKGRYYETYAGLPISIDGNTGERFIWNEGPPRRKNPLGEGASPIGKIYVDQDGKPLEPQPI